MDIGMLWFDNDKRSDLKSKVSRAAVFYRDKYGKNPNICYVHPSMVKGEKVKAGDIEVRSSVSVLPNHFWIGVQNGSSKVNGNGST